MSQILAIALMSFANRAWGNPDDKIPKAIAGIIMGWACSVVMGVGITFEAFGYVVAFWLARSIGPGNAVGPALTGVKPARYPSGMPYNPGPEWWQFGPLLDSAWLSMAFLGFMWGIVIWVFTGQGLFIPVCVIALLLAVVCARHVWGRYEYWAGGLIGLGAYLL
jgi:hypothetical protein